MRQPGDTSRGDAPAAAAEDTGFMVRQRVTYRAGERSGSFEAVVQLRCGELTIIGLAPFGARAFTIRDGAAGTTVDTHLPVEWPFPPEHLLRDVQRTYLVPAPSEAPPDGTRTTTWRGEHVSETWSAQRLRSRHFQSARSDAPPTVSSDVRNEPPPEADMQAVDSSFEYPEGLELHALPMRLRIHSLRYGYRLEVTTLTHVGVACGD